MRNEPSNRILTVRRPALPRQVEGKGGASVFVVLALLALAIFFYVRAVAPPESSPAPVTADDSRAPLPGTPATVALPPVAPAGEGRPAGNALDPKLVDALSSVIGSGKPAAAEEPAAAPAEPEAAPPAEAQAPAETASPVAAQAPAEASAPAVAAAEPAPVASAPAEAAADELKPLPAGQLDAIRDLFAPELQR